MDGSIINVDVRCAELATALKEVQDFVTARGVICSWATKYRLQPCTTIATKEALLISYHDQATEEVNYGCRQFYVPYTPHQKEPFQKAYTSERDVWWLETKRRFQMEPPFLIVIYALCTCDFTRNCVLRFLSSFGNRISSIPCFSCASASSIITSSGRTRVRENDPQNSSRWK